jgi:thioesterase domain-containing protein
VRLFAQIATTFDKNLPLSVLLKAPTIEQLAVVIRQGSSTDTWSPLVEIKKGGAKPPLFCIHGGGFNVLIYRELAMRLSSEQPVYGLQARGLDGKQTPIQERLADIAADYIQQIRTVQPKGPYALSGLSNGGNIALEMSQQLIAEGEEISFLGMFDSYASGGNTLLPPFPRLLSSLHYALRFSLPRLLEKLRKQDTIKTLQPQGKLPVLSPQASQEEASDRQSSIPTLKMSDLLFALKSNGLEALMDQVSQYILDRSPWAFLTPKGLLSDDDGNVAVALRRLEEEYDKTYKAYIPKPYSGKIYLFRAAEAPPGYHMDPHLGWGVIAMGGVDTYKIPGHHISLMKSSFLAEKVQACLDKACQMDTHV